MTKLVFFRSGGVFYGFEEQGHTGYGEEGDDVLCAALSAMTMLIINTVEVAYASSVDFTIDEENKTYTFVVAAENTKAVFGYEIATDVSVKILHSGADITGVILTYTLIDEDNDSYPEIKVTIDVTYSYDSETITIE